MKHTLAVLILMMAPAAHGADSFSQFGKDHMGRDAETLTVTALGDTVHGLVLHDGQCAYAAEKRLGCFDPQSLEHPLGCGRPQVADRGSIWLYLHGVALAPFDGSPARYRELALWAFSHVVSANGREVFVWGMGIESSVQELWRWNLDDDSLVKVVEGPAELSGGVARLADGERECLLLSTYKPVDQVCEGMTSAYRYCGEGLEKIAQFKGCSSRMAGVPGAVFNFERTGLRRYQAGSSSFIQFRPGHLDSWVPLRGQGTREVLFDGRTVTVFRN